jgi:membrane fusion protein (multidrug efflux system)
MNTIMPARRGPSAALNILTLLVAALLVTAGCRRGGEAPATAPANNPLDRVQAVEVVPLGRRTLEETVELVGPLAANESAELRPELSGTLVEILFEEGARLAKGAPIARLDTRELEAQLAETRARFTLAERNLGRLQQLLQTEAASRLEFDEAEAEFKQLEAALKLLETRLDKSTLRAPFDGVAGARPVSVGDYVSPQVAITTIDDLSRLKVELEVPERYLPRLRVGTVFTVHTAAGGEVTRGEVYFIPPVIELRTRAARVKGYIIDPPPALRPGMFANVVLVLRVLENVLVVPETAILTTPRGTVVVVARTKDGQASADFVPVRTGVRVPGFVEITPVGPPLAEGDRVVSAGVGALILLPGMKLQPVEPVVKPGPPEQTDRTLPAGPATR